VQLGWNSVRAAVITMMHGPINIKLLTCIARSNKTASVHDCTNDSFSIKENVDKQSKSKGQILPLFWM